MSRGSRAGDATTRSFNLMEPFGRRFRRESYLRPQVVHRFRHRLHGRGVLVGVDLRVGDAERVSVVVDGRETRGRKP